MLRLLVTILFLFTLTLTGCQADDPEVSVANNEEPATISDEENTADEENGTTDTNEPVEEEPEQPVQEDADDEPAEPVTDKSKNEPAESLENNSGDTPAAATQNGGSAEDFAEDVVQALSNEDMQTLSGYVHPTEGVRFSPYSYVNVQTDLDFTAAQVQGFANDTTIYSWGFFDGTGDDIDMTYSDYHDRFVFDEDYLNPDQIVTNTRLGPGSSLDNSQQIYPNATIVEYHFSGFDPALAGMDWRSLRLVVKQDGNQDWWLVGIIHDEWTT